MSPGKIKELTPDVYLQQKAPPQRNKTVDWYHSGMGPHGPDAPRPYLTGPLCPMSNHVSPVPLLKFQMALKLMLLIFSSSRKKEPRCICLS